MSADTLTDAIVAAGWAVILLDNLGRELRERGTRIGLGPVIAGTPRRSLAVRGALVAAILAGGAFLEWRGERQAFQPLLAVAGVSLVAAGTWLHTAARRTLGIQWSDAPNVRAGQTVVTAGPYALVRHPIYLALLLVGAGTVVAHPSGTTICGGIGLALGLGFKIRSEERLLHRALGPAYAGYAARVPALCPSPTSVRAWLGAGRVTPGTPR